MVYFSGVLREFNFNDLVEKFQPPAAWKPAGRPIDPTPPGGGGQPALFQARILTLDHFFSIFSKNSGYSGWFLSINLLSQNYPKPEVSNSRSGTLFLENGKKKATVKSTSTKFAEIVF